jgi:hypothetical protein
MPVLVLVCGLCGVLLYVASAVLGCGEPADTDAAGR